MLLPLYCLALSARSFLVRLVVPSFTILPAREDVEYGKDVLSKLLVGCTNVLIEISQLRARLIDDPFVDFGAKSCQAILVGNQNFADCPFLDLDQKPRKTLPLVIEAGRDVCEDLGLRETETHLVDLPLQIFFLLVRGDATVDRLRRCPRFVLGSDVEVGLETMTTRTWLNGCNVVPPMPTDGSLELDCPCIGPSSESWLCDSKSSGCVLGPQPLVIVVHRSLIYERDLDQLQILIAKTSEYLDFALRSRSMT